MRFYFHEAAEVELDKAIDYYEECRPGLGLELAEEVYAAIDRVIKFPEAWSPMSKNTRRCLVNRFPFGVIYRVRSGCVEVVAVADLRRRPEYWQDR
jgi:plasmid stabilization system protein ParE